MLNIMNAMLVYKITNTVNDHGYVGITTCALAKRWREHLCAAKTGNQNRLYRAMRKYGTDNFKIEVIAKAANFQELQEMEKKCIIEHDTHARNGCGYNLTEGGEGRDKLNQIYGEQFPQAVLTEALVAYIRDPQFWNVSNAKLLQQAVEKFGFKGSRDALKDARNGKSWKHLNEKHPPVVCKKGTRKPPLTEEQREKQRATLSKHHADALKASAAERSGRRAVHAKLHIDTIKNIFYSDLSLLKTANKFGISKKMVLLIKQRKAHVYLTKGL